MSDEQNPVVVMVTSMGTVEIELFADKAPVTVANFLQYVDDRFYDGLIFHRVIRQFMIQGGGYDADFERRPTLAEIENEAHNGWKNDLGTVAMARTNAVNSATAQFFINAKDNEFLNFKSKHPSEYGYCVFGKVTDGMDVVAAIERVKTTRHNGMQDVPAEIVQIESIRRKAE